MRGRKPTHPDLKLVMGNPGKRKVKEPLRSGSGNLGEPPRYLAGRAREIWREVAPSAWWLEGIHGHKLGVFCALQAGYERAPQKTSASRMRLIIAFGSDLGLSPAAMGQIAARW